MTPTHVPPLCSKPRAGRTFWSFAANLFAALLFVTAAERWLRAVERAHAMLPYLDSWKTPALAVNTALEQGPGLQILPTLFLGSIHNDSIKFVPVLLEYIISLPAGYWTPESSIWLGALGWVTVLGLAIGLCCGLVRHPLARLTIVALGCLIGFSPSFRFLVPFGIHRVVPLASCLGSAALLSRPVLVWRSLLAGLLLALGATFSFANGFLAFAVIWVALLLRWRSPGRGDPIRLRSMALAAALFTAISGILYGLSLDFYHQKVLAEQRQLDFQPAKLLASFMSWVSSPLEHITGNAQEIFSHLGPDKWAIQIIAVCLGLLAATGFLISARQSRRHRPGDQLFLTSLVGGLFLPITLLLARYRNEGFHDERYLCETSLLALLIATILFSTVENHAKGMGPMGLPLIAAVLMFGLIATVPLTYTWGYFKAMHQNLPAKVKWVEHCIITNEQADSDLWNLCNLEEIAPVGGYDSQETFVLLQQKGYLLKLGNL